MKYRHVTVLVKRSGVRVDLFMASYVSVSFFPNRAILKVHFTG